MATEHWYQQFRRDVGNIGIACLCLAVFQCSMTPRDDTDTEDGPRSGVNLRTDHGTGCQYLADPMGGITPRLDASGEHICGERAR
jgi:hypothetical protein